MLVEFNSETDIEVKLKVQTLIIPTVDTHTCLISMAANNDYLYKLLFFINDLFIILSIKCQEGVDGVSSLLTN